MLEFHRKMLGDTVRNDAFREALQRAIVPEESVVADIGSGTGFLSFLARKLGAKECHLYESGDVLMLSERIAKDNGIVGCKFIHRHSTQVQHPAKADIVVSETLGNFALEEHILENMNDARERFLTPGGTLIPFRLSQYASPVVVDRLQREIDTWDIGYDLDYGAARTMGFQNAYVRTVRQEDLLQGEGAVQTFDTVDFREENESKRGGTVQWKMSADASVYGVALWWEAELAPGLSLSTSPSAPLTHWEQIYLPIPEVLSAKTGDALSLSWTSDTRYKTGLNLTWKLSLFREGKKVASSPILDMKKGHLN